MKSPPGLEAVRRATLARAGLALALAAAAALMRPLALAAQVADLEQGCTAAGGAQLACAAGADIAAIAPARVLLTAFGGNPIPGTASTMGYRLPGKPRVGLSARLIAAPVDLSTSAGNSRSGLATGLSANVAVGLVDGATAMSTVGGIGSLDLIGSLGLVRFPGGAGFSSTASLAWALGVRLGVFRESFTLPGLSVTAMYGRLGSASAGDTAGGTGVTVDMDAMSAFNVTAAVGKRIGLLGWTAGASWMHHRADVAVETATATPGGTARLGDTLSGGRISAFGSVTWTLMVLGLTAEGGWQSAGNGLKSGRTPASGASAGGPFFGLSARLTF